MGGMQTKGKKAGRRSRNKNGISDGINAFGGYDADTSADLCWLLVSQISDKVICQKERKDRK